MINTKQAFNISRQVHIPNKHANIDVLYGPYESISQARETVPEIIRERGLTVGIINSFNGKLLEYWWKDGTTDADLILKESSSESSNTIPIYTRQMAQELNPQGDYITIPGNSDFDEEITDNVYRTSKNGELPNIIFSALRQLQAEIARLKNSFIFGFNSYKNRNTAFSSVLDDYAEDESEEPLWAIDPEALSLVLVCKPEIEVVCPDTVVLKLLIEDSLLLAFVSIFAELIKLSLESLIAFTMFVMNLSYFLQDYFFIIALALIAFVILIIAFCIPKFYVFFFNSLHHTIKRLFQSNYLFLVHVFLPWCDCFLANHVLYQASLIYISSY